MKRGPFVRALALSVGVVGSLGWNVMPDLQAGDCDVPCQCKCQYTPSNNGLLDSLDRFAGTLVKNSHKKASILGAFKLKMQISGGRCDASGPACGCESSCSAEPTCGTEPTCGSEASCGVEPAVAKPRRGLCITITHDKSCGVEPSCGTEPTCGAEPTCGTEPTCGMEPSCGAEPTCGVASSPSGYTHASGPIPYPDSVQPHIEHSAPPRVNRLPTGKSVPQPPAIPVPNAEDSTNDPFRDDAARYQRRVPATPASAQRRNMPGKQPQTVLSYDHGASNESTRTIGKARPQTTREALQMMERSNAAANRYAKANSKIARARLTDEAVDESFVADESKLSEESTVAMRPLPASPVVQASASEPARLPPLKAARLAPTQRTDFEETSSRNPLRAR